MFIPQGSIHRIENLFNNPVKIIEIQTGTILKETDIIRYKDIYGRVKFKKLIMQQVFHEIILKTKGRGFYDFTEKTLDWLSKQKN